MREPGQAVVSERHGAFLAFRDENGIRHAIRLIAVLAVSDADDSQDATILQLPGGRFVSIRAALDDVLAWFPGGTVHGG